MQYQNKYFVVLLAVTFVTYKNKGHVLHFQFYVENAY